MLQILFKIGFATSCIFIMCSKGFSQKDSVAKANKSEIFSSGFIDIMNNGQVNASARFIKLFIGEPGKLSIPLSFYGGVSSNNFQNNNSGGQLVKSNDHLVNQYINPMSGLINVSIEGIAFRKKDFNKLTRVGGIYQIGERVLNGVRTGDIRDPRTGKPTNFLNAFGTTGFYFQTGAWENKFKKRWCFLVHSSLSFLQNQSQTNKRISARHRNQWRLSWLLNRFWYPDK